MLGQTVSEPQQLHSLVQSCQKVSGKSLAMSSPRHTGMPLKQGLWKLGDMKAWILKTTGTTTMIMKNLITTDFPNINSGGLPFECELGNFGEAREQIKEATGQKDYNIKVNSAFYNYIPLNIDATFSYITWQRIGFNRLHNFFLSIALCADFFFVAQVSFMVK